MIDLNHVEEYRENNRIEAKKAPVPGGLSPGNLICNGQGIFDALFQHIQAPKTAKCILKTGIPCNKGSPL